MGKRKLKTRIKKEQSGVCALSGEMLPEETELYDTDRIIPKAAGGTYTDPNTRVVEPVAHMVRHGNYREREEALENLKSIVDDRNQVIKIKNKIDNQIRAYERNTDTLNPRTLEWLQIEAIPPKKRLAEVTKELETAVKGMVKNDPLMAAALGVKAVGKVTVAYMTVYADLAKANHASSLWKYVGLHTAMKDRYIAGETSGGNKTLRTALWTMADSQIKSKNRTPPSAYGYLEEQVKHRLENSDRLVWHLIGKKNWKEMPWKDVTKGHRHGAACRAIIKHFLADYWYVGRTLMGLPTDPPYAVAVLKGNHRMIMPEERGWIYEGMKLLH